MRQESRVDARASEDAWRREPDPRVLLVSPSFVSGAASWGQCIGLADRLPLVGWPARGISTFPSRLRRLAHVPLEVRAHRDTLDAAVVDVFSGTAFFFAEWASGWLARAGIPQVLVLHGGNLPVFRERWPRRVARLLRSAARVVAPSTFLKEAFASIRDDIEVIPNAIEAEAYRFAPQEPHPPSLVWLRAFHELYNPELAVEVLSHLCEEFPELTLTMGGAEKTPGALAAVQARVRELGLGERVRFLGKVPKADVGETLAAHTLYLNTPHIDNTPVTVIEAMASGCAVISTRVGGTPHLTQDGVNGLLVPDGDASAMAEAAAELLRDPARLRSLAAAGVETSRGWTWPHVLPTWGRLLDELASPGAVRS